MLFSGQSKHIGENAITREKTAAWYDKKRYSRDIDKSSLEKWKQELYGFQQVRIVEAFQDDLNLKQIGYDFSLTYMPTSQRIKAKLISYIRKIIGNIRMIFHR